MQNVHLHYRPELCPRNPARLIGPLDISCTDQLRVVGCSEHGPGNCELGLQPPGRSIAKLSRQVNDCTASRRNDDFAKSVFPLPRCRMRVRTRYPQEQRSRPTQRWLVMEKEPARPLALGPSPAAPLTNFLHHILKDTSGCNSALAALQRVPRWMHVVPR
jgi:hypothetical protein